MHNDQFGNQSTKSETKADKEWSEFERDLETLGRQLAALQVHTAALGTPSRVEPRSRFQRGESPRRASSSKRERSSSSRCAGRRRARPRAPSATRAQRSTEAATPDVGALRAAAPRRQGCRRRFGARLGRAARLVRQGCRPAADRVASLTANGPAPGHDRGPPRADITETRPFEFQEPGGGVGMARRVRRSFSAPRLQSARRG